MIARQNAAQGARNAPGAARVAGRVDTPAPAPINAKRSNASESIGTFQHFCGRPGCEAWGSFGFRGAWFCRDHRADGEALMLGWADPAPAGRVAARVVAAPKQGSLW